MLLFFKVGALPLAGMRPFLRGSFDQIFRAGVQALNRVDRQGDKPVFEESSHRHAKVA